MVYVRTTTAGLPKYYLFFLLMDNNGNCIRLKLKRSSLSLEKLVSLLPEYVVPYMIHLLAHDPDFTKPHEYEQLKDIKE